MQTEHEIEKCVLCEQHHPLVMLTEYNERGAGGTCPFATHWYICPVTNDPVPMTFTGMGDVEIDADIASSQRVAQMSGRWLTVVFWIEGNDVSFFRKTDDFPLNKFSEAVRKLDANLGEEVKGREKVQLPKVKIDPGVDFFSPKAVSFPLPRQVRPGPASTANDGAMPGSLTGGEANPLTGGKANPLTG